MQQLSIGGVVCGWMPTVSCATLILQFASQLPILRKCADWWNYYIFIGTPVWWMQDPMIIHTFMETAAYNGFAGKTVIPFCTYYSGPSAALSDIVAGTPQANHLEGYGARGGRSYSSSAIASWLERIGIMNVVNGISSVSVNQNESKAVYTIDGRLVAANGSLSGLAKGVYVMGGRKFTVR